MPAKKPGIVFAHGLWADGSCFQKLIPALQADGHEVMCSQHGLDSLKGDVDCVRRCFGRVSGPVVLVGHSYGGTLITHAGTDERVAALVYISALAPDRLRPRKASNRSSPLRTCFLTSASPMDASGSSPTASGVSQVTCRRPSRRSCWRPRPCRCQICSPKSSTAPLGDRSRAGTSWPPRIAPCILIWSASPRSAWARQPLNCTPVTFRCSPSRRRC